MLAHTNEYADRRSLHRFKTQNLGFFTYEKLTLRGQRFLLSNHCSDTEQDSHSACPQSQRTTPRILYVCNHLSVSL